jgi:hypothetical protein
MKKYIVALFAFLILGSLYAQEKVQNFVNTLPELSDVYATGVKEDWLVNKKYRDILESHSYKLNVPM